MAQRSRRPGTSRAHTARNASRPVGAPRRGTGSRAGVRPSGRRAEPVRRTGRAAHSDSAAARVRASAVQLARRLAEGARPSGQLTTRAAVLGLVVCALVLSLAYPVRQYLAQRTEIASLVKENAKREQNVQDLQRRQRQLADPAYIRAQARSRLQYAYPGDSTYIVVDPKAAVPATASHSPARTAPKTDRNAAWYGQLTDSVRRADRAR